MFLDHKIDKAVVRGSDTPARPGDRYYNYRQADISAADGLFLRQS